MTRVSLLSRNFGYQLLSSRFHRFVICMHMLRYSKWGDWSLTISNSVHCLSAAFPALNVTCIKLISHVKCIVSPIKSPINQYYVDKPSIGLKMKKIIDNKNTENKRKDNTNWKKNNNKLLWSRASCVCKQNHKNIEPIVSEPIVSAVVSNCFPLWEDDDWSTDRMWYC